MNRGRLGHVEGHPVGRCFADRKELSEAGVYRPTQAGIVSSKPVGADSIVLSGATRRTATSAAKSSIPNKAGGTRLEGTTGPYAEAAHIQPLGDRIGAQTSWETGFAAVRTTTSFSTTERSPSPTITDCLARRGVFRRAARPAQRMPDGPPRVHPGRGSDGFVCYWKSVVGDRLLEKRNAAVFVPILRLQAAVGPRGSVHEVGCAPLSEGFDIVLPRPDDGLRMLSVPEHLKQSFGARELGEPLRSVQKGVC